MRYVIGFFIWIAFGLLQQEFFHIEHDAYVMLYGGATMALMILAMELFNKDNK
jgi:hypothetical protein